MEHCDVCGNPTGVAQRDDAGMLVCWPCQGTADHQKVRARWSA